MGNGLWECVKTNPAYPIISCRGRVCLPEELFSGEQTSPLRTRRQYYPRFDTPCFLCRNRASLIFILAFPLFFFIIKLHLRKESTGRSETPVDDKRQSLSPPVSNPLHAFLSFLTRFISRTRRFRPFGYACLSVELLQSSAADCIVRCSGPYSLLQWTVQSIAADCNNLPFKRPWPNLENGLFFPLFGI